MFRAGVQIMGEMVSVHSCNWFVGLNEAWSVGEWRLVFSKVEEKNESNPAKCRWPILKSPSSFFCNNNFLFIALISNPNDCPIIFHWSLYENHVCLQQIEGKSVVDAMFFLLLTWLDCKFCCVFEFHFFLRAFSVSPIPSYFSTGQSLTTR